MIVTVQAVGRWWISVSQSDNDPWVQFDEYMDDAEAELEAARECIESLTATAESPPEIYWTTLRETGEQRTQLEATLDVTANDAKQAADIAARARLVNGVLGAHLAREKERLERRLYVLETWFDGLNQAIEEAEIGPVSPSGRVTQQLRAASSVVGKGEHLQLVESDRIDIEDIESSINDIDERVRESAPEHYAEALLDVFEAFNNQYLADLETLTGTDLDLDDAAISVADQTRDLPDLETLATHSADATAGDLETFRTALDDYIGVVNLTGQRIANFHFGTTIMQTIRDTADHLGIEESNIDTLEEHLLSLEMAAFEEFVVELLEAEHRVSDDERLVQLLAEHDGSVAQTLQATDYTLEELIDQLQRLYGRELIADIEVQIE